MRLVVWAARLAILLLAQGALLLLSYAYFGFDTDPRTLPVGFQFDPILAGVNFVFGLVGSYVGFFRPRYAFAFVFGFALCYTALALIGTFAGASFGTVFDERVNILNGCLAVFAWALGLYGLWRGRRRA